MFLKACRHHIFFLTIILFVALNEWIILYHLMENPYVKIRNTLSLLFTLKPGASSAPKVVLRIQFFLQVRCHVVHHWHWLGQRTLASVPWAGLSLPEEPPWVREALPLFPRLIMKQRYNYSSCMVKVPVGKSWFKKNYKIICKCERRCHF